MPSIPCPIAIRECVPSGTAGDPDFPITNNSAETPDIPVFIGDSDTRDGGTGPSPNWWFSYACGQQGVFCKSTISQKDADDCAAKLKDACSTPNGGGPSGDGNGGDVPATGLYYNVAKTCSAFCGSGVISYTQQAGTVISVTSQADADEKAMALACAHTACKTMYFVASPPAACVGEGYFFTFQAVGGVGTIHYTVVSGSEPLGMYLDPNGGFGGMTTVGGIYTFTVRATDSKGSYFQMPFTLQVFGASNSSPLPAATLNSPYSDQLVAVGNLGVVTWSVVSGSLPTGITLDSATGLLSGTPTAPGTFNFVVQMMDT